MKKIGILKDVNLVEAFAMALDHMVRGHGRSYWGNKQADEFVHNFVSSIQEQLARKGLYKWIRLDGEFVFVPVDEAEEFELYEQLNHTKDALKAKQEELDEKHEKKHRGRFSFLNSWFSRRPKNDLIEMKQEIFFE
jgi:ribulose-5-phosphate 4-epimerase/fuculose-1-phosphate aldolase